MQFTPDIATKVLAKIQADLQRDEPDAMKVARAFYSVAHSRARLLAQLLRQTIGPHVYSGPFKGMELSNGAMGRNFGPSLTGDYEHELHAAFEWIIAQPYEVILNIGCSFGFYSTGLALRMPNVRIEAFDIAESARKDAAEMAQLNKVQDRVHIGGEFQGSDFAKYAGRKVLALVDIEGAEKALLDPALYPALRNMDVLVELHDLFDSNISKTIRERFAPTHDIEMIYNRPKLFDFTPITGADTYINPFDPLIINLEFRDGPTPWAMMSAKGAG